jgi:hypothetical protein
LVQGLSKRNTLGTPNPAVRHPLPQHDWLWNLFDRDRKPADQPRNLVQILGIVMLKGLRQPGQAFVIAHGGGVARTIEGTGFRRSV